MQKTRHHPSLGRPWLIVSPGLNAREAWPIGPVDHSSTSATDVGAVRGFRWGARGDSHRAMAPHRSNPLAPAIKAVAQCSEMLVFSGISCFHFGKFKILG
jgi:hypothetical protein